MQVVTGGPVSWAASAMGSQFLEELGVGVPLRGVA